MRGFVLLLHIVSTGASTILAFGDSWAFLGYDQFKSVMGPKGMDTALRAIPGTPAGYWSMIEPHALVSAVDANNATHVYLSVGGNDFLEGLPLGVDVHILYAEMMASTLSILNTLFKARPDVHVYHFGYELLNWDASTFCRGFGDMELKGDAPLFCTDARNVSCMTHVQAQWLQTNFIDELAKTFAAKGNANYHGLNLLGALQVAGGVPGAKVGAPNWSQYSPTRFVRNEEGPWGCVHLTPDGYTTLYTELAKHILAVERQRQPSARGTEYVPVKDEGPVVKEYLVRKGCNSNPRLRQCFEVSKRTGTRIVKKNTEAKQSVKQVNVA